ncbi:Leucine rich repeat containing 59 [Halocaridina rubra]|uniref:Leucine rich repeat containing 59 n=1 Tax=Halocaridina rubra TaxID=373956 RepID=A0AAN8WJ60_HALRR
MSKNGLRKKVEGDELDLSMLSLTEVPVKEIASVPKATKIDLSSNELVSLSNDFAPSLSHITRLELGSNKLRSLPSNIDKLVNLRHLDLYNNQLTDLPISLCQLRNLRWLDLKGNPLKPGLQKAAGDCLNQKECEIAARKVIAYLKRFHIQMENEKQERLKKEKEKEDARARAEEEELSRKRAEKRAAKEKRKAEHRAFVESHKHQSNGSAAAQQKYVAVPKPAPAAPKPKKARSNKGWSWLGWFNLIMFICLFGAIGAGLYVYTDGNLTPHGIAVAYPNLVKNAHVLANLTADALQPENLRETAYTVGRALKETGRSAWAAVERQTGDLSMYTDPVLAMLGRCWSVMQDVFFLAYDWLAKNIDWDAIYRALQSTWRFLHDQWLVVCDVLGKNEVFMNIVNILKIYLAKAWELIGILWVSLCHQISLAVEYIQAEGPGILASVKEQTTSTFYNAKQSIEGLMK